MIPVPTPEPEEGRLRHIMVRDGKAGLPYSKGLMATSIMAAGLPPLRAHHVAEVIERRLRALGADDVTVSELRSLAGTVLAEEVGPRYAENYRRWQAAQTRDVPLVVLIGGSTGVGKSTVATTVAARLGIVRIVSTDAVREVMRGIFTEEMMPALHTSTFEVPLRVRESVVGASPVLAGFREQVQAVAVGLTKLIRRSVVEGTDLIVEGAHVVPGFLELPATDEAVVAQQVIVVDDPELHRSHFQARAQDARARGLQRYLEHFEDIRVIQDYVRNLAIKHEVPVVTSYSLDATVARVMELVVTSTTAMPAPRPNSGQPGRTHPAAHPPGDAGPARGLSTTFGEGSPTT